MSFWNSLVFFDDPADVGNLISGSSAFSKTSLNIWKFTVHVLLKPGLENFEHYWGSMGRPSPGFRIELLDVDGKPADEGEIALAMEPRPLGLMIGYADDASRSRHIGTDGYYRTGDVAARDADGNITYIGRADDVFKCSDYRISPFELESVLIEHPAVAEAAIVPSPDPVRLSVPNAFVSLVAGREPSAELAGEILLFVRGRLAPYKRIRRLEFVDLPKTISGKIRRVDLRKAELARETDQRLPGEYFDQDFREGGT